MGNRPAKVSRKALTIPFTWRALTTECAPSLSYTILRQGIGCQYECQDLRCHRGREARLVSRAFVRNSDADTEPLPDRPISSHPNFVTLLGRQPGESIFFQGGEAELLGIEV